MRYLPVTALAAVAIFSATPAFASATLTVDGVPGTPLAYQIYGISSVGNPVYGSSPNNSNTANVTFTGNSDTQEQVKNGFATITDANKQNSQLYEIIINPTQYDFNALKFAVQLTAAGSFDVFALPAGTTDLVADNFASYTLLTKIGTGSANGANQDVNYLVSGANLSSIMIRVTTPGVFLYQVEQMSYGPLNAPGVPEPGTWAMMLLGFGGIGMAIRRRRKAGGRLLQVA